MASGYKHHSKAQLFALMNLVKDTYTSSGLEDSKFSAHATATLGFKVSAAQVSDARVSFDIPSNTKRAAKPAQPTPADVEALLGLVGELSSRLAAVESTVASLKAA